MDSILLPKNVDASQVTFGNLKALDNGGKTVYLSYNGRPLTIQTPQMQTPFGSSRWSAAGPGAPADPAKDKHSVELSFKGHEANPSLAALRKLLADLDERMVEGALDNSSAWFKKKYNSKDVVAALYTPMLKRSKNKDTGEPDDRYPPTMRLSLPFADGKFKVDMYGRDKAPIELSTIEKGSRVTAILQCLGLWVAGGKFGCTWKVVQLWVIPPDTIKGTFAFRDDGSSIVAPALRAPSDEDDDAFLEAAAAASAGGATDAVPATEMVDDSEDEDDDPIEQKPVKRNAKPAQTTE